MVPTWFEIPDEVAEGLVVTDLKVGRVSQQISTGAFPAELFASTSPRDELLLYSVGIVYNSIMMSVANLTDRDIPFECCYYFDDPMRRLARYQRALVCGLGVTKIAPLGSARVVVQPEVVFSPDRLFVPRSSLEKLVVDRLEMCSWSPATGAMFNSVRIGVSSSDLHPDNLRQDSVFRRTPWFGIGPAFCFVLHVRNLADEAVNFTGAILGSSLL
jgi:hypothetical protein